MTETINTNENGNCANRVLAPVFNALEYAYDNWGETINYMTEDEIEQISDYENKDEVDGYLRCFYERT
jgi:hypothetical protein